MFAKTFASLRDNIIQKTTNPFLGTVIIVWLFHNWKLVFGVFNFDKSWTLEKKWEFIGGYLEPIKFTTNLVECLSISVVVLIITYFLLNFSRLIINFYEKKVTPLVYKMTDKNSVVLKSTHEILYKEKELLEQRLEEERNRRIQVQNELERLEKRLLDRNEKNLKVDDKSNVDVYSKFDIEMFNLIEKSYSVNEIREIINEISSGKSVLSNSDGVKFLLKYDFVSIIERSINYNKARYQLTDSGKEFKKSFFIKYGVEEKFNSN